MTKKKCKGCKTEVLEKFEYCYACNQKLGKEIIIGKQYTYLKKRYGDEEKKCSQCDTDMNIFYKPTSEVDFYKLIVIEKFKYTDEITLKCIREKVDTMNLLISDLRHMGIEEIAKRKIVKEKARRGSEKLEVIKAYIELFVPLKGWKTDLRRKGLLD